MVGVPDRLSDVVVDEVGVDVDRGGGSLAGRGDHLSPGVGDVAGHPQPGDAGAAGRPGSNPAVLVDVSVEPTEQSIVRAEPGRQANTPVNYPGMAYPVNS